MEAILPILSMAIGLKRLRTKEIIASLRMCDDLFCGYQALIVGHIAALASGQAVRKVSVLTMSPIADDYQPIRSLSFGGTDQFAELVLLSSNFTILSYPR